MDTKIVSLKPTVYIDGGSDGRVVVADSLSYFEHAPWFNDVTVGASFAGVPTAAMCMRQGSKAWIAHEGGPGKDEAGIGGLGFADRYGVPAAAIATMEARLSGGMSLLMGHVSRLNISAKALGVRAGQTGEEAARYMLKAKMGQLRNFDGLVDEEVHHVLSTDRGDIYACWSFSRVRQKHPNDVFCVASHGARVMAVYALRIGPKGMICNDAGKGMDDSGIEGLQLLEQEGIAAASVSTDSARIGDALSTFNDGIISAANAVAYAAGVSVGMSAAEASRLMLARD